VANQGVGHDSYYDMYYSGHDWKDYREIIALVIRHAEPGPILDVGAGCGFFVEGALRWGLPCKGLEGSRYALEKARMRYPEIDVTQHLLSDPFPYQNDAFQAVIMNQVIEHLEPEVADACLMECYRVLRPGGMLFVASPSRYNRREQKGDPTHLKAYAPKQLQALIVSKGFSGIIPMNSPFMLLGDSKAGRMLVAALFRILKWDFMSATANCIAFKPVRQRNGT
jgi:2-polyprenyl-3-methyl-5-hydroxy-6-metoxy-1,4-benzoquinol methylase